MQPELKGRGLGITHKLTAVVATVTLLVNLLDMLVTHGSQREPLVAVFTLKYLLLLAQMIVIKMNSKAGKRKKMMYILKKELLRKVSSVSYLYSL